MSARAELLELAGWLDGQLDGEDADLQLIVETTLRRVQALAASMPAVGPAKLRDLIAGLLGTMRLQGGGYHASGEMLSSDRDRIASAVVLLLADVDRPGPAAPDGVS